jgi:uncharacterized protein
MQNRSENTLVGYHAHCTDGMVAAWAASVFGVPKENLVALSYDLPLPGRFFEHANTGKPVVFLDYRPKLEDLKALDGVGRAVFVVDHHKAAFEAYEDARKDGFFGSEMVPKGLVYIFDNDHSGARLAWDFFQGSAFFVIERPYIIDLAEDYDLWRKKLPLTEEFHIMTSTQELTIDLIADLDIEVKALMSLARGGGLLSDGGSVLVQEPFWPRALERLHMRDDLVKLALSKVVFTDLAGHAPGARFPMVNSTVFRNEVAQALLARGHEVAVVWAVVEDGRYSYSLRSKDVDVAALARKFGGNGHTRAAGFTLDRPLGTVAK